MFELSKEEDESLRSQIVSLKGRGQHSKYLSFAFTEQGVAMLSSVLRSERAIEVNVAIMRAFVQMRQLLSTHAELKKKIEEMEAKYDEQFQLVFEAIRQFLVEEEKPKQKILYRLKSLPCLDNQEWMLLEPCTGSWGGGIERAMIFRNRLDREDFLARLAGLCRDENLLVYAGVLMSNHSR